MTYYDEALEDWVAGEPAPSAEDEFFAEEDAGLELVDSYELADALKRLTARQRFVIELHYGLRDNLEGWTFRDIGRLMGLEESTVREHYMAGIRRLRAALDPRRTSPTVEPVLRREEKS